jgi:hypothetical protein
VSRIFFPQREFSSEQWYFFQTIAFPHFIQNCHDGTHWGDAKNAAGSKSLKPWRERCCGSDCRDQHGTIDATLQWSVAELKMTVPA